MPAVQHPLYLTLAEQAKAGPVVVAHRGDSIHWPENSRRAFAAARAIGAPLQEFDVRCSRDGALVCMHDAGVDRTTDAAVRLGPGALVQQLTLAELQQLRLADGEAPPTLRQALDCMLPDSVPLIEHKAGTADSYVGELRRARLLDQCILQSFDWQFVAAAKLLAPELAVAVLGPTSAFPRPDAACITAALQLGAGMLHWRYDVLSGQDLADIQAAGLLLCGYTCDDEVGWRGAADAGWTALCTNDPTAMLAWRRQRTNRDG